ncbi:putative lim domain-containing serine threonine-protein kinase [Neofusicoccum parvum]|uniref:Lim domain-containing serine threonine-protein kinase n=1 Tax=Neofusicoccum parvum TaxID=310453 RepID=A0ACB5SC27_9PEZI|nr:putative lim domain-containing serine threonine-protein kinase [Neofusicoccum parvum]
MPVQRRSPILKETVVAAWRTDEGDVCGLGCATPFNDQDPNLMFTVLLDEKKERMFVRIGLSVMVKGGGHRKLRAFDFLVPLFSSSAENPALDFSTIDISKIQDDSISAAVSNARLSNSGRYIRAEFHLAQCGFIVTPWKEDPRFSTCSDTSLDLLSGLFSLSESRIFVLYMGLSDYAEAGLNQVRSLLQSRQLRPWLPEETGVYDGRSVMNVSREQIESGRKHRSRGKHNGAASSRTDAPVMTEEPPPYDLATTLVPRSPSDSACRIPSPSNSFLAEDSCVSERNAIFDKTARISVGAPSQITGKRKRTGLAEEALQRTLSDRLKHWLCLAFKENDRVYGHIILQPFFDETIPSCIAECDATKFDVGIAYATAVLACDPQGTCDLYWAHRDEFLKLVDDIRALVLWSLQRDAGGELRLWRRLMDLGGAARTTLHSGDRQPYDEIKASIVTQLVLEKPLQPRH